MLRSRGEKVWESDSLWQGKEAEIRACVTSHFICLIIYRKTEKRVSWAKEVVIIVNHTWKNSELSKTSRLNTKSYMKSSESSKNVTKILNNTWKSSESSKNGRQNTKSSMNEYSNFSWKLKSVTYFGGRSEMCDSLRPGRGGSKMIKKAWHTL